MSEIEFVDFNQVNPEDLLAIVNEDSLRVHLIDHPYFDGASLQSWMEEKIRIDLTPGCRVRAVLIHGELAGWSGIQPDDNGIELAIVISRKFWGYGISIFKSLIEWARQMGHKEILFHLLDSRPEYRALHKIASKVVETEQFGRRFTTYYIPVGK